MKLNKHFIEKRLNLIIFILKTIKKYSVNNLVREL